jgi:hypothetical protein
MRKSAHKSSFSRTWLKKWSRSSQPFKIGLLLVAFIVVTTLLYAVKVQRAQIDLVGTYPSSPFQSALHLDGNTSFIVNDSNAMNPSLTTGFTAEAWVKPDEATFSAMTIFDKSVQQGAYNKVFSVAMEAGHNSGEGTYRVNYYFYVNGSDCQSPEEMFNQQIFTNPLDVISWHHVAAVIHPTGGMDLFVDGQHSTINSNRVASLCADTSLPFSVGSRHLEADYIIQNFHGDIDDIHIANSDKYTVDFPRPTAPTTPSSATIVLYHLDGILANYNEDNHYGSLFGNVSFVASTIPVPTSTAYPSPSSYASPYPTYIPYPSPSTRPSMTPNPTCIPNPCQNGAICKLTAPRAGEQYCPVPSIPPNCVYKQVQCIKAPCNPVLVCSGSPSPYPSPTSSACRSLVTSLNMSNRCGTNGFASYSYQCDGRSLVKAAADTCLDAAVIYQKVSTECGAICKAAQPVPLSK